MTASRIILIPKAVSTGGGGGGASAASDVTFTPTGSIAATNVQTAIAEVATDAAAAYATSSAVASAVSAHESDTTNVHGIADTSVLLTTTAASELIRDTIGTALAAGSGITITVNDGADTITVASSITQYTDEMARDALGTALAAGSNITLTVNDAGDTITIAASGGSLSANDKLNIAGIARLTTGRYYGPGEYGGAFSTAFTTAINWMAFIPWICPADLTADRIGIYSNSATGNIRLGIYSATSTGAPNALIVDSGAIAVGSSGVKEATISQALTGGTLYYLACVADANLNIGGLAVAQCGLLMGSATLGAAQGATVAGSQAYGALPSSPPTVAYDASTSGPCIQIRAS